MTCSPLSDAHYAALAETARQIAFAQVNLNPYYQSVTLKYAKAMEDVARMLTMIKASDEASEPRSENE